MRFFGGSDSPDAALDVAIIGNGSLGMSLARALKMHSSSLSIAVLGPPNWPGAASTTAGAMLNCWAEISPGTLEDPALDTRFRMVQSALSLWDQWAADLANETSRPIHVRWGTIVTNAAGGYEAEDRAFDYMSSALAASGKELIDATSRARTLLRPEAHLRPMRAMLVPDGFVDSRQVMAGLVGSLEASHVMQIHGRAQVVKASKSGGGKVEMDSGDTIRAGTIVIANGSFARELRFENCSLGSSVLPLFYGGGSALQLQLPSWTDPPTELRDLDVVIRTMDRGGACGFHLVPLGCPDFYFGASSGVWESPEWTHRAHALSFLLNGVEREFHKAFFHAGVSLRGPGFRPVSLDGLPLIGETSAKGIWYLNGTKRDGFTSAPFITRELAKAILGQTSELPKIFAPERSPISYLERDRAIEAAVNAAIGGELMHGLKLPPYRLDEWESYTRNKVEQIYTKRGIEDFGIHPELLHFYEYDHFFEANIKRFLA